MLSIVLAALGAASPAPVISNDTAQLQPSADRSELSLAGEVFHTTARRVAQLRTLELPGGPGVAVLWSERDERGAVTPFFAISRDGRRVDTVKPTRYEILMRDGAYDPQFAAPDFAESALPTTDHIHIVQFETQALESYRQALRELGAEIYGFVANHAYLVRLDSDALARVRALEFVRWVGPYHGEYRTDTATRNALAAGGPAQARAYQLEVFTPGAPMKDALADAIVALGGTVLANEPDGSFLQAKLDRAALLGVLTRDEVLFLDPLGALESDMDVVREVGGADFLEMTSGWTGQGVNGEIADGNLFDAHPDFAAIPPIFHGPRAGGTDHGTPSYGIVFGDGTADPLGRGLLPDGQGIFADGDGWKDPNGGPPAPGGRYGHVAELVDPSGPYRAVFQSSGLGSPRTTDYTTASALMDEIVFDHDIVICQSQSNAGTQESRPQAWAKNIVSVGGINHFNTPQMSDDTWSGGASIGPAADGRIKPDFAHFFDTVFTTANNGGYTEFGGTSAATPIVAGHFGLFFQMWHNGIFGNTPGTDVFDSRPHFSTAKALLIHSASQWFFTGTNDDLTRTHQGWGAPDLAALSELAAEMFIIDETVVLENLETVSYEFFVSDGPDPLRATLVYSDPKGTTSSSQHRINDLTLKVTAPDGTEYWGNNGLEADIYSAPGGVANTIDTVENVFIQDPDEGFWTIEVIASEINQDAHVETPAVDADFALAVSGTDECIPTEVYCTAKPGSCGLPVINVSGKSSASSSSGFFISSFPAPGNRVGQIIYSDAGRVAIPFQGGTLCVNPASIHRGVPVTTGGSPTSCFEAFFIDWNAFAAGALGGNPEPFLLQPGTLVQLQWWGRDTVQTGSYLSDAAEYIVCD